MRQINPENVAPWFDPWKLKGYCMLDGYDNYSAPLSKALHVKEKTVRDKISQSRLTHEETLAIARAMNLTMEQYCAVFAKDLYGQENTPD